MINQAKKPIILADVGTAIVVSALDKSGGYRGCAIYPGIRLAYRALSDAAAQLPDISIGGVARAIGRNSVESMHAGLTFGTAAMLDGLIDKFTQELGESSIVITGAYAEDIIKYCRHDMNYNESLLLDGLYEIYMKNQQNKRKAGQ
jgi:type III pantothenate kinase